MSSTKFLIIFVLSILFHFGTLAVPYREYKKRKDLINEIFSSDIDFVKKVKFSLILMFDECKLRLWKSNFPFSGPCSYMNVRNKSKYIAVWGCPKSSMIGRGFEVKETGEINVLEKYLDGMNPGKFDCQADLNNINDEWSACFIKILECRSNQSVGESSTREDLRQSRNALFKESNGEETIILGKGAELLQCAKDMKLITRSGIPILDGEYSEIKGKFFFHCNSLKETAEKLKSSTIITVFEVPNNEDYFVACPAPVLYFPKAIWSLFNLIINNTERVHIQKRMIYLKEKFLYKTSPKKQGQELSPCDWVNSEFRTSSVREKVCLTTSSCISGSGDVLNISETSLDAYKYSLSGATEFIMKESRIVFKSHYERSSIKAQISWYDIKRNELISQEMGEMKYTDYNKMLNLFRLIQRGEISGVIERSYTILGLKTMHFKSPTRIFKDFCSGSKEAYFTAEIGVECFIGSAEIVITEEIQSMNKLSSSFDDRTLKMLILHNFFFFKKVDFNIIFKFIPGTFIKRNHTDLGSSKFKRYSSDISKIFTQNGLKPIYRLIPFPKTDSLKLCEETVDNYSLIIGKGLKIINTLGDILIEESQEEVSGKDKEFNNDVEEMLVKLTKTEVGKTKNYTEIVSEAKERMKSYIEEGIELREKLEKTIEESPKDEHPSLKSSRKYLEELSSIVESKEKRIKNLNDEKDLEIAKCTKGLSYSRSEKIRSRIERKHEFSDVRTLNKQIMETNETIKCVKERFEKFKSEFVVKDPKAPEIVSIREKFHQYSMNVLFLKNNLDGWVDSECKDLKIAQRGWMWYKEREKINKLRENGNDILKTEEIKSICISQINKLFSPMKDKTIHKSVFKIVKKGNNLREKGVSNAVLKVSEKVNLQRGKINEDWLLKRREMKTSKLAKPKESERSNVVTLSSVKRKNFTDRLKGSSKGRGRAKGKIKIKNTSNFKSVINCPKDILKCIVACIKKGVFLTLNKIELLTGKNLKKRGREGKSGFVYNREIKDLIKLIYIKVNEKLHGGHIPVKEEKNYWGKLKKELKDYYSEEGIGELCSKHVKYMSERITEKIGVN